MRRAVLFLAVLTGALAVAGAPAYAHGGDAPDATAYRTTVTTITPPQPGLTVRAVEAGARLELINHTGRTIEVLGYSGEPYLEVRTDGTYTNVRSPATYLNRTLDGRTPVPATADPTAPPHWQRVSGDPAVRWHDQRTYWMSADPPDVAVTDPDRTHRLRDWAVPLRDGVRTFEARGTLDWVPPPTPGLWWGAAIALGALVAAVHRRPAVLATVALITGITTWGYAVARELDAGAAGAGALLGGLLAGQVTALAAGLFAVAAAVLLPRTRSGGADFAVTVSGAAVLIFAGLANAAVFTQAVAPVPGPSWWARLAVLIAVGGGLDLLAAGVLRLRSTGPARQRSPWRLPASAGQ